MFAALFLWSYEQLQRTWDAIKVRTRYIPATRDSLRRKKLRSIHTWFFSSLSSSYFFFLFFYCHIFFRHPITANYRLNFLKLDKHCVDLNGHCTVRNRTENVVSLAYSLLKRRRIQTWRKYWTKIKWQNYRYSQSASMVFLFGFDFFEPFSRRGENRNET